MSARSGTTVPDRRGRTGLERTGRDLTRNPDVVVRDVEVTSDGWHVLRRTTYDYRRRDGAWTTEQRETYDRGNGATILLYDLDRGTVLLTHQFRYPVYVNDHPDGMLVETAAGLLDDDDPETPAGPLPRLVGISPSAGLPTRRGRPRLPAGNSGSPRPHRPHNSHPEHLSLTGFSGGSEVTRRR